MLPNHDLLELAATAADRAARYIRSVPRPRDPDGWQRKGFSDFVTEVDREAERLVTETLLSGAPESVIQGEELSPDQDQSADLLWIVDPLDGTTNYLHGYPAYAVSIAAMTGGRLAAGIVVDVPHGITYRATAGGGSWCNGDRIAVSRLSDPADALIGTGFPFKTPEVLPQYLRQFTAVLRVTGGVRRGGSAALDLIDVALGRLDGFWELHLAPWDVAAGTLIVREAGGVVTNTEGSEDVVTHGPIVAGNGTLQAWLLETLRRPL